jgi:hypothetical protein
MSQKNWQLLLQKILETELVELSCPECFEVLDQYAELFLNGTNPSQIMPLVKRHLDGCHCCAHEFEALMLILQQAATGEQFQGL